jgi:hypothetical protein
MQIGQRVVSGGISLSMTEQERATLDYPIMPGDGGTIVFDHGDGVVDVRYDRDEVIRTQFPGEWFTP